MIDLYPVVVLHDKAGKEHVIYQLQPKQLEAYRHTPLMIPEGWHFAENIGYGGAAGGGKSHSARAIASAVSIYWPGSTSIIFRKTEDEVIVNHVNKFRAEVPEKLPDGTRVYSWNGERMCVTWENGSRIYFGYLRQMEDAYRYQGNEYDFMCFEESTLYGFAEVRWLTGNRLRATVEHSRPFVYYPSNPGGKGHFWYKRVFIDKQYYPEMDEKPENFVFIQAKLTDNQVLCERDPKYIERLNMMPEPYRSWMRDGKWDAGLGLALPMIDPSIHLIKPFDVPDHWPKWGSFDWGYSHPWVFGLYTKNEDGRVYKVCTITGRMQQPNDIALTVAAGLAKYNLDIRDLRNVQCGHDLWADIKARGEDVPTLEEHFREWGWRCAQANISRVAGLNVLRRFLSWQKVYEDGSDGKPFLLFMNEPGNVDCIRLLQSLPTDDTNIEDSMKLDADAMGKGGDDMYDETRYGMSNRVMPARTMFEEADHSAFSPGALRRDHLETIYRGAPDSKKGDRVQHPEFGAYY